MMRIGKRSLAKIGAVSVTGLLTILAVLSVMSPKQSPTAERKAMIQLQIKPLKPHIVSGPGKFAARRASSRVAKSRSLSQSRLLTSKNVTWHHKNILGGRSKINITAKLTNVSKLVQPRPRYKALKSKDDIRAVLNNIRQKRERTEVEMLNGIRPVKNLNGTCIPQVNVAYIKTHKTASTTLQTIVNRFGLLRKLSFVLNKVSPTNGHLVYIPVTKYSPRLFFLPPLGVNNTDVRRYRYNMVAVHLRYNRSVMDTFMEPGTKYITIIREPSAHFESAFNHFRFIDSFSQATRCRVKGHEIEEFMRKPGYYRRRLKKLPWDTMRGIRWYYARNNQIFDLGLDSKYHDIETIVNSTIDTLVKEMDLVLISEYFDESLVLLKNMLCWSFDDIVYISKNQRPSRVDVDMVTRQKIRKWSRADTIMYERFNATLWQRIRDYGPNFDRDLAIFRRRKDEVFSKCVGNETIRSHGIFQHREYTPSVNSSLLCTLAAESKTRLFHRIWQRQAGTWGDKLKAARILHLQKSRRERQSGTERKSRESGKQTGHVERTDVREKRNAADDTESAGLRDGLKTVECENLAPETNIDFQSSDGHDLIFPEEV